MRKLLVLLFFCPFISLAQTVSLNPTVSPALFRYNDQITVVYDVTSSQLLSSLTNAYAWVWIPGTSINAQYNINPATTAANPAKFTKSIVDGKTLFTLTFTPSTFFTSNISNQTKMGILLKGPNWSDGQTSDFIMDFWDGSFQVKLTNPVALPLFVSNGEVITISAETPVNADYKLFINDQLIDQSVNSTKTYSYQHTVIETAGYSTVKVLATVGASNSETSFQYIISTASPQLIRPSGVIPGINYSSDPTKVTLCLLAPGKNSAYVRGDFSNWEVLGDNMMNRDGEYFWIELSGLTSGQEYAFQYLIDENLWLADPYADKYLDPDDQFIPQSVYPSLKTFPSKALSNTWYFNRLSVFQTNQQPYQWQVTTFQKPSKEKLVIYELLIRDFFGENDRSYTNLIDTLSYLKRLGVNAIQLMPIMEFGGNESWGYNPQFMFAPDKAYGPKNTLKQFIDVCHQNGIAVILDIAMNHQDMPNPYLLMDFNYSTFKPNPTNKWFNVDATHPFSVFFDMNHESSYTKKYLDTINYYWLNEYKVDGYRFDLSKGFTQVNSGSNVSAWSGYDASRVAIIKRMSDKIWSHSPEAYIILEHFADNSEEKVLAQYRAGEGKGMMLWGNLNYAYSQNTMGYNENSDISWIYHGSRTWSVPYVVGYMESHDEERMMYRNFQFGRVTTAHNIKTLPVALNRVKAASTIFYTLPGPKMLWQFGELGYDVSIEEGGRVSPKPVKWEYRDDYSRYRLYTHVSDLIRLHKEYDVFNNGTPSFYGGNDLIKQIVLKNSPYTSSPTSAAEMNAVVVANFDVIPQIVYVEFPHTGIWYDYYRYGAIQPVDIFPFPIQIPPGGYKIFTDYEITNSIITEVSDDVLDANKISFYPNPTSDYITVTHPDEIIELNFYTLQGIPVDVPRFSANVWDLRKLPRGVFISEGKTSKGYFSLKVIKN